MSYFASKVVEIKLTPHPNADKLSIVSLTDPFECTVVVRTEDWQDKDLGIYIMPDSIVPDSPEFEFLGDKKRIKASKLRGVLSYGLLIPAKEHHKLGDEVHEELGITKYEEPIKLGLYGKEIHSPDGEVKYTDIQNIKKYHKILKLGEEVVITEKVHGANARYLIQNDKFYIGTHRRWISDEEPTHWSIASDKYQLKYKLLDFPNYMFCGEVYGYVQDLRYGHKQGDSSLIFYDIYYISSGEYLNAIDAFSIFQHLNLPIVPILYWGKWLGLKQHESLSSGLTHLGGNHCREGFVIKTEKEKYHPKIGRTILKMHSEEYLTR